MGSNPGYLLKKFLLNSLLSKIEIFGQRIPKAAFVFYRKNRQRPFGILCITFIMTIDQEIGKITFATNNKKKPIEASWITKYELGFKMQEKHFGRKLLLFWIFSFKTLQKIVSIEKKNHCSDLIWYASLLISTGFQFSWSHFWNDLSNHLYDSVNKRSFLEIINLYRQTLLFTQIKFFHLKQYAFWRNQ